LDLIYKKPLNVGAGFMPARNYLAGTNPAATKNTS